MGLSRRSFLGGALSLGALAGCRAFRYEIATGLEDQDAEDRPLAPSVAVTPLDCFGNRGRTLSAT